MFAARIKHVRCKYLWESTGQQIQQPAGNSEFVAAKDRENVKMIQYIFVLSTEDYEQPNAGKHLSQEFIHPL